VYVCIYMGECSYVYEYTIFQKENLYASQNSYGLEKVPGLYLDVSTCSLCRSSLDFANLLAHV
jgi:hypothetical protein